MEKKLNISVIYLNDGINKLRLIKKKHFWYWYTYHFICSIVCSQLKFCYFLIPGENVREHNLIKYLARRVFILIKSIFHLYYKEFNLSIGCHWARYLFDAMFDAWYLLGPFIRRYYISFQCYCRYTTLIHTHSIHIILDSAIFIYVLYRISFILWDCEKLVNK